MRVVKSGIRNFPLEPPSRAQAEGLRSRDPKFEMEERSSLLASQRPSRGNSKLPKPDPQFKSLTPNSVSNKDSRPPKNAWPAWRLVKCEAGKGWYVARPPA
jgi:hypothetical protein